MEQASFFLICFASFWAARKPYIYTAIIRLSGLCADRLRLACLMGMLVSLLPGMKSHSSPNWFPVKQFQCCDWYWSKWLWLFHWLPTKMLPKLIDKPPRCDLTVFLFFRQVPCRSIGMYTVQSLLCFFPELQIKPEYYFFIWILKAEHCIHSVNTCGFSPFLYGFQRPFRWILPLQGGVQRAFTLKRTRGHWLLCLAKYFQNVSCARRLM